MGLERDLFLIVRCVIGLAWVDGELRQQELSWLNKLIERQGFSAEERTILSQDLSVAPDYLELFKSIPRFFDREKVIDFARVVFNIDGEFHPLEKQAFEQLKKVHGELSKDINEKLQGMGNELVIQDKKAEFYKDLSGLGRSLSRRPKSFLQAAYPRSMYFQELIRGNRLFIWFFVIFFGAVFAARVLLPLLLGHK